MFRVVVPPIKRSTKAINRTYGQGDAAAPSNGGDQGVRSGGAGGEFHRRRGRARHDPGGGLLSGQKPRGAARRAFVRAREGTRPPDAARRSAASGTVRR